jgi:hypothetical protein
MVTGLLLMLSTQLASHGAGQIRPCELWKIVCALKYLDSISPFALINSVVNNRNVISQWTSIVQKGTPQSMQRDACCLTFSLSSGV